MGRNVKQLYRLNLKLRRRGDAALENHHAEFKSEDYDDDESLCVAIASEVMEMITADREYLSESEEGI